MEEDNINNQTILLTIKAQPLKLLIRTPSYNAHLNAVKLATELEQSIEPGSYNSPSLKSGDEHSDLESTSPKLKFGNVNITEYIPSSLAPSPDIKDIQETDLEKKFNTSHTPKPSNN